ncbi:MAG: hypothetical protein ACD_61C00302G0006 [uncultured bacterium]|nr:MAG: hypothetical protein ACD_61C00302G0006 [uncultured bacterium]
MTLLTFLFWIYAIVGIITFAVHFHIARSNTLGPRILFSLAMGFWPPATASFIYLLLSEMWTKNQQD